MYDFVEGRMLMGSVFRVVYSELSVVPVFLVWDHFILKASLFP